MVYSDNTFIMVSGTYNDKYFTFVINKRIANAIRSLEMLDDRVDLCVIDYSTFDWDDEEDVVSCYKAMQQYLYDTSFFRELPTDLFTRNTIGILCVGSEEPKLAFSNNVDDEFINTVADTLLCPNESKS